jgi:hypothetical protein
MRIVPLHPIKDDVIAYARDLLARCEAGEVIAVTAVEEYPGGTYAVGGSSSNSRTQTAGMLLDAAITRLSAA